MDGGRIIKFGTPGLPDILGIRAPWGQLLGIEVKTGRAIQSQAQNSAQRMIEDLGGLYIVARQLDDVEGL